MSENPVIFKCARCGETISTPVTHLTDLSCLQMEDGQPLLPKGSFVRRKEFAKRESFYHALADDFILNLEDLSGVIEGGRRNGCCGCDGLDSPNFFCKNNHPVATEHSDCWMPRFAVLLHKNVQADST